MPSIDRELFEAAEEGFGKEIRYHERYSGRAMYGETCLGFSGRLPDLIAFAYHLGRYTSEAETAALIRNLRVDQYGLHHIVYFPAWQFTEDA